MSEKHGITTGPMDRIGTVDLNSVGYWIVGMFVVTWAVALAVWRLGHVEERWELSLATEPSTRDTASEHP